MNEKLVTERQRIGQMIGQLMKKKGYTHRRMAELTGLLAPNISKIVKGNQNTGVDSYNKVCQALNVRLTDLEKEIFLKDNPEHYS